MTISPVQLQTYLKETGRYSGAIDGGKPYWFGRLTQAAILLGMTDGPDTKLIESDFRKSASRLQVQPAAIRAFWKVEANGAGFQNGRPKILPEPHRFSKATGGRFDKVNPAISYPVWRTRPYPASQDARYDILIEMIGLDIDAGFGSASYGAPQIMGENFKECGYDSSMAFAFAMARDEVTQLRAFEAFIENAGILPHLRKVDRTEASWHPVTRRYNGTAHALNGYPPKILRAFVEFGGV
jgi:hypothetical protein